MKTLFYLLLFLCIAPAVVFSQKLDLRFKRISVLEGLSHSTVKSITQDDQGYMWFGTEDGLNKYDGYTLTVYKHSSEDSASICSSNIINLSKDKGGNLWICTNTGVDLYQSDKNNFIHCKGAPKYIESLYEDANQNVYVTSATDIYLYEKKNKAFRLWQTLPAHVRISSMYRDKNNRFWVSAFSGELFLWNDNSQQFIQELKVTSDILQMYEDGDGNFWLISVANGLMLYNREKRSIVNYKHDDNNTNSLLLDRVQSIKADHLGRLWLGCENAGLSIFDKKKNVFYNYTNDPADAESLSFNSIVCFYLDRNNDMWLGTFSGGVNFVTKRNFNHKFKSIANENSLSNNSVTSFCEDQHGNIWIGTDGGGLNKYDIEKDTFTHFYHDPKNPKSIGSNVITSILHDKKGNIWCGHWLQGMSLYDQHNNNFIQYRYTTKHKNTTDIFGDCFMYLYDDSKNNLWVSILNSGLHLFDKRKDDFIDYYYEGQVLGNYVCAMEEGPNDNLWVGTWEGLHLLNPKTKEVVNYLHVENDTTSLSNNKIYALYRDSKERLWIGTAGGLNCFDYKKNIFTVFDKRSGFPSDLIYGILEDGQNNLWLSTSNGLSKFNPETKKIKNFNVSDGLQGNDFKFHASLKLRSGELLFGGTNGFNRFDPNKIKDNTFVPPVVITDFRIFNTSIVVGAQDSILQKHISLTKELKLSYQQSVFSFDFAALNFIAPEKNQYAYMLAGFDKDWNYSGTKRTATYTNLDPGEYIFKVMGSNNDGVWNKQGASLKITITPPYWGTWWFRIISVLVLIGGAFSYYGLRLSTIRKQKVELEMQVRQRTDEVTLQKEDAEKARQEAEQANRAKSTFLATMSHEIRTPMNGVIGMAALLSETNLDAEQLEYAETIRSSGESLLSIINDILDFSKIESGQMELDPYDLDLRTCVEDVLDLFSGKAADMGLDLLYQIDHDVPPTIFGDGLRLRQVLINLISNAIKFTKEGEIFVGVHLNHISDKELELCFEIRDTGIGIEVDKISRLFKAFSQVDSSTTRKYGGTGLGLAISEKLVALMEGTIKVNSKVGSGSTFTFTIRTRASSNSVLHYIHFNTEGLQDKKILIVDDNVTNLLILQTQLRQWKFSSVSASSAKEALERLKEQKFDLVITDMQMPHMDGVGLAEIIRVSQKHLPLILLSSIGDEHRKRYEHLFTHTLTKPVKQKILFNSVIAGLRKQDKDSVLAEPSEKKLSIDFAQRYPLQILIAEDNPVNQLLAMRIFKKLGYEPILAENGNLVIEKMEQVQYDIIFMDVQMPQMDGLNATRMIRKNFKEQPIIIAMTANAMAEDKEECVRAGMNDYISKPVKLEILVAMLEKWASTFTKKA